MISINETVKNCSKSDDLILLDSSDHIVTENVESTDEPLETSEHDCSFISPLNKSELDIELEICEDILALDENEDLPEQPFDNNELDLDVSDPVFENGVDNIKLEPTVEIGKSTNERHEEENQWEAQACVNGATVVPGPAFEFISSLQKHEQLVKNTTSSACVSPSGNQTCDNDSREMYSSSDDSEDEFDFEIKKCLDILNSEESSDSNSPEDLSQTLQPTLQANENVECAINISSVSEIKSEEPFDPCSEELIQIVQHTQVIEIARNILPVENGTKSEKPSHPSSRRPSETPLPAQFIQNVEQDSCNILSDNEIKSENTFDASEEISDKSQPAEVGNIEYNAENFFPDNTIKREESSYSFPKRLSRIPLPSPADPPEELRKNTPPLPVIENAEYDANTLFPVNQTKSNDKDPSHSFPRRLSQIPLPSASGQNSQPLQVIENAEYDANTIFPENKTKPENEEPSYSFPRRLSQIPLPSASGQNSQPLQVIENIKYDDNTVFSENQIKSKKLPYPFPRKISPILPKTYLKTEPKELPDPSPRMTSSIPFSPKTLLKTESEAIRVLSKEIKSEKIESPTPTEAMSKIRLQQPTDSDDIRIVYESTEIKPKLKSEIQVPQVLNKAKDDDVLSLFAETDTSSIFEEYEVLEEEGQDEDTENKPVLSSVVAVPDTQYLEEEREDIYDSGWESMRNLSTDDERYKLVRKSWRSAKIPDPNRNLSYHSYRKRHLQNLSQVPRTRKRKATSSLDVTQQNPPKRQRSCTFMYDLNIESLSEDVQKKQTDIRNEMETEVNKLNNIYFQQEQRLQREYYLQRNATAYMQLCNLRQKCQMEVEYIRQQYYAKERKCTSHVEEGINNLFQARSEVLQFFQFYKGFSSEDPTVLTTSQQQELEEIEKVYVQFHDVYKQTHSCTNKKAKKGK